MVAKNIAVVSFAFILGYWFLKNKDEVIKESDVIKDLNFPDQSSAPDLDGKHVEIFKTPKIVKVRDGVHVAIGFALGNSIMIEGSDGIIIVDTTESSQSMIEIMREFRKITKKPLKAVIVTHFHTDHVVGTKSLIELEGNNQTKIFAHKMTLQIMLEEPSIEVTFYRRAVRQFGFGQKQDNFVGAGIGMDVKISNFTRWGLALPTDTYEGRKTYNVAGITFELIHTPGETPDQTSMWIPGLQTYLPADNIYQCFPNLYAIRGSPPRNSKDWYESLDVARKLRPMYLVPSHTNPIIGEEEIYDTLTVYRDAIKFVHDQTVRYTNKGWYPDQIADYLRLPASIANHPFLNQYYGTVEWSVRGVFDQYLGWFSGDPADLTPLSNKDRAQQTALLLASEFEGSTHDKIRFGVNKMLEQAKKSLARSHDYMQTYGKPLCKDDKWALMLVRDVMSITKKESPLHSTAVSMKIKALYSLHLCTPSANGRHYFIGSAMEEEGRLDSKPTKFQKCLTAHFADLHILFKHFALRLDDTKCAGYNLTVVYQFTENLEKPSLIALTIRNCICDVIQDPPQSMTSSADLIISMTSSTLRDIFCGKMSLQTARASGLLKMGRGEISDLKWFMDFFE